jgi:ubiquinone/menaquinone biosynthesis C-methylase UbiE
MKGKILHVPTKEAVVRAYDNRYRVAGDLRESDVFYRWALSRLKPRRNGQLLDVACGEGHLVKWAQQAGVRGAGIDLSGVAVRQALQVAPDSLVSLADGERLPFPDASFDYITNMGSLEHFVDPLRGIREMARVLRDDGRAAVYLPNSHYLVDIIWHVWRTGYSVSHRQLIERFATAHEWRDLLEEGGLKVRDIHAYNYRLPRSGADWEWYRRHPRKWLNLLVAPLIPFHLSYSFLFIASKSS